MIQIQKKVTIVVMFLLLAGNTFSQDWEKILNQRLPEYGHRNWIIIADAAYPKQSAAGIETIVTGACQLEVLRKVLAKIDASTHIQPILMLDFELNFVPGKNAPGVKNYRNELKQIFGDRPLKVMPHEEIIRKLDDASKLFNILLLKTNLTIPYTSVFIELDCGYWNAEKEKELRDKIRYLRSI